MQRLDDLRVDLVRQEEFAFRRWFYASPLWYYHRPGEAPPLRLDRRFYELIDPDLRELCLMLHRGGLATAPSCQGHFHRMRYFHDVWEQLQGERDQIRGPGLLVLDSETRQPLLFRCAGYELPWGSFEGFYRAVASRQQGGYLGVRVPLQRWKLWERLLRERHGQTVARFAAEELPRGGAWTLHVRVRAPEPRRQWRAWQDVEHHLRLLLRRPDISEHDTPGLFEQ